SCSPSICHQVRGTNLIRHRVQEDSWGLVASAAASFASSDTRSTTNSRTHERTPWPWQTKCLSLTNAATLARAVWKRSRSHAVETGSVTRIGLAGTFCVLPLAVGMRISSVCCLCKHLGEAFDG